MFNRWGSGLISRNGFGAAIAHTERPEVNRRSETSGSKAARDLRKHPRPTSKAEAKVYWSKRGQPCGEGHSLSCGTVPLRRRARKRALSKAVIVAAVVRKRAWKGRVNNAGHAVRRIAG